MESDYPLKRTWCIWEMFDQNVRAQDDFHSKIEQIGEFSSLLAFWQHWHHLPHADPRQLFYSPAEGKLKKVQPRDKPIDSIAIFEEGVDPTWEDPQNESGSDLTIRSNFAFNSLKTLWDGLVFAMIGETLPESEKIVGCRVVDKRSYVKFEVWCRVDMKSAEHASSREALERHLAEGVFSGLVDSNGVTWNQHLNKTKRPEPS